MSKEEFIETVLSQVKNEQESARADDWRGKLQNWTKC